MRGGKRGQICISLKSEAMMTAYNCTLSINLSPIHSSTVNLHKVLLLSFVTYSRCYKTEATQIALYSPFSNRKYDGNLNGYSEKKVYQLVFDLCYSLSLSGLLCCRIYLQLLEQNAS